MKQRDTNDELIRDIAELCARLAEEQAKTKGKRNFESDQKRLRATYNLSRDFTDDSDAESDDGSDNYTNDSDNYESIEDKDYELENDIKEMRTLVGHSATEDNAADEDNILEKGEDSEAENESNAIQIPVGGSATEDHAAGEEDIKEEENSSEDNRDDTVAEAGDSWDQWIYDSVSFDYRVSSAIPRYSKHTDSSMRTFNNGF